MGLKSRMINFQYMVNNNGGMDKPKHWKSQARSARMRALKYNFEWVILWDLNRKETWQDLVHLFVI